MNFNIYRDKKKLIALAAVVIICAACLVTAAYAYNALYKDDVEQKDLSVVEDSRYFYITGDLSYGQSTPLLSFETAVDTVTEVTDSGTTITGTRSSYTITHVYSDSSDTSTDALSGDTVEYLIGTLTIHNKGVSESDSLTAHLTVPKLEQSTISGDNNSSLFVSPLGPSNIKFRLADDASGTVSNNNYITSVTTTKDKDSYVNVYISGKIDTTPDMDRFIPTSSVFTDDNGIKALASTEKTYLVLPGFTVTIKTSDVDSKALVDSTFYKTLSDAVAAAQPGQTVTLVDDATLDTPLALTKGITIDGQGHTLTASPGSTANFHLINVNASADSSVTLKNLSLACDVKDDNTTYGVVVGGGTGKLDFTAESVNFSGFGYKALFFQAGSDNTMNLASANITGCSFTDSANYFKTVEDSKKNGTTVQGGDHALQFDLRNNTNSNTAITVSGCAFTGNNGILSEISVCDSKADNSASIKTFTVTGCTFSDSHGYLGNIAVGSTPAGKGDTSKDDTNNQYKLQDFPVSVTSAQNGTVLCYRGYTSISATDVDKAAASQKGFDASPLKIVLNSGDSVSASVNDGGKITLSGTARSWNDNASNSEYVLTSELKDNLNAKVNGTSYNTVSAAISAAESGSEIEILGDISEDLSSALSLSQGKTITINLNGHTLTNTGTNTATVSGGSLTISGGSLKTSVNGSTKAAFSAEKGGSVTLDHVVYDAGSSTAFLPLGNASSVAILNSTVTTKGAYVLATNSATVENYNVVMKIVDSVLTANPDSGDACTVMINVNGTLDISGSTISGTRQVLAVRAGTATVSDTTFNFTKTYTGEISSGKGEEGQNWGSGNEIASAALVLGDTQSKAYNANAVLTLTDCAVNLNSNDCRSLVMCQDGSEYTAKLVLEGTNTGVLSNAVEYDSAGTSKAITDSSTETEFTIDKSTRFASS